MFYNEVVERDKLVQVLVVLKLPCGGVAVVRVWNYTDVNFEVVSEDDLLEQSLVLLHALDEVLIRLELDLLVLLVAVTSVDLGQVCKARAHRNHVQLRLAACVLLDEAGEREWVVAVCGEHGQLVWGYLQRILQGRYAGILRDNVVVQISVVLKIYQALDVV